MAAGLNSVAPSWVVQSDWSTASRSTSCRTMGSAPPEVSLPQPTAVSAVPAAGSASEAAVQGHQTRAAGAVGLKEHPHLKRGQGTKRGPWLRCRAGLLSAGVRIAASRGHAVQQAHNGSDSGASALSAAHKGCSIRLPAGQMP